MGYLLALLIGVLSGIFGEKSCAPDSTTGTGGFSASAGGGGEGGSGGKGGATVTTSSSTTGAGGGTGGTGGEAGAGGTGGAGGQGTGGIEAQGGGGTGGCMINPSPCAGGLCGTQPLGCGETFDCKCWAGEVCDPGTSKCCTPLEPAAACAGKCNVQVSDGCGGMIQCDGVCGNSPLMYCTLQGSICRCKDAVNFPGYDQALATCNPGGGDTVHPVYCGSQNDDIPANCINTPPGSALWCCQ